MKNAAAAFRHLALLAATVVLAQGAANVTGCLNSGGQLSKVAVGDSPSSPCPPLETQVSLKLGGSGPVSYYLKLSRGTERVIGTYGDFSVVARCVGDTVHQGGIAILEVNVNTYGNWFFERSEPIGSGSSGFGFMSGRNTIQLIFLPGTFDTQYPSGMIQHAYKFGSDTILLELGPITAGVSVAGADCMFEGTINPVTPTAP